MIEMFKILRKVRLHDFQASSFEWFQIYNEISDWREEDPNEDGDGDDDFSPLSPEQLEELENALPDGSLSYSTSNVRVCSE